MLRRRLHPLIDVDDEGGEKNNKSTSETSELCSDQKSNDIFKYKQDECAGSGMLGDYLIHLRSGRPHVASERGALNLLAA